MLIGYDQDINCFETQSSSQHSSKSNPVDSFLKPSLPSNDILLSNYILLTNQRHMVIHKVIIPRICRHWNTMKWNEFNALWNHFIYIHSSQHVSLTDEDIISYSCRPILPRQCHPLVQHWIISRHCILPPVLKDACTLHIRIQSFRVVVI